MLPETVSRTLVFGTDPTLLEQFIASFVAAFLIGNLMLVMAAVAGPWAKRKISTSQSILG